MDYLSLKAAVNGAGNTFIGRKVRETRQISLLETALLFPGKMGLLLSIDSLRPGLFIIDTDNLSQDIGTPFSNLLKARTRGTTLISLNMPEYGERLVFLRFEAGWPAKSGDPVTLILEVMGRHSNLSVVHNGNILQPLKVVSAEKSRLRPVFPGAAWKPPPSRPGTALEKTTSEDLPDPSSADADGELQRLIRGLSPYTARQALLKASGGSRETLQRALAAMVDSADGEKGYLHSVGDRIHLSPFQPLLTDKTETCESFVPFSAASSAWRKTVAVYQTVKRDDSEKLESGLRHMAERLHKASELLDQERRRCLTHGTLRVMAETLLIHGSEELKGEDSVIFPNPYEQGKELIIPLDPSLTTIENANRLFERARRMQRGAEKIQRRRAEIESRQAAIETALISLLEKSDPGPAVGLLGEQTRVSTPGDKRSFRAYSGPGRRYVLNGFTILVGRGAADNESVTFEAAGPHDLWLHARDYPGSHVVILTKNRKVPDEVLNHAAILAAGSSKASEDTAPEIMVTERKWVRKLKGGKPGKVTVQRYRTVRPRRKGKE
jgi:predicted ribosome quality control (RQC) complex YloA/Tae2 family protein